MPRTGFYDKMKHIENSGGDHHENSKFTGAGVFAQLLIKAKIQEQNGRFLTHYALGTVSGLIRAQAMANENATRDSLMASMRIQGAESVCRVYRKMVRYPDFHRQLIAFRRLMQDYGLTLAELPEKSEGQRELKALLALIADLPFTHLQEERFLAETRRSISAGPSARPAGSRICISSVYLML